MDAARLLLAWLVMASIAIRCSVSSTGEENSNDNLDPRICVGIYKLTGMTKIRR